MKKSMLTLVGCALAAGTVMAAEVAGNNTAVVIQKDAVVSNNYYQFLIVPVKGFDITGGGTATTLTLAEILPPVAYTTGTTVYAANDTTNIYKVDGGAWVDGEGNNKDDTEIPAETILWMKTSKTDVSATVFCGEQSSTEVSVTPQSGFVAFGNATSAAVEYNDIKVDGGEATKGDLIYCVKEGSYDYYILRYNGDNWTKPPASGNGAYVDVVEGTDVFPAGAAAYYYRK
ncbi:MAG: hypothetical protein Q4F99_03040 [bacterium]|nr:hypothetical protein [bacterium]